MVRVTCQKHCSPYSADLTMAFMWTVHITERNLTPTLSKQSKSTQAIHQGLKPYLDLFIDTKALVVMSTVCLSSGSHINCRGRQASFKPLELSHPQS